MALMVEGITSEKTLADMGKMMDDYKKQDDKAEEEIKKLHDKMEQMW